jgi:hypothetical protein
MGKDDRRFGQTGTADDTGELGKFHQHFPAFFLG